MVEASGARGWSRNRRCLGMVWKYLAQGVVTNGGRGKGSAWIATNGGRGVGSAWVAAQSVSPSTEMRHRPALSLRAIRTLPRPIH